MKNLWAPWRLQYVLGRKGKGCFLCRALRSRDDRRALLLKRGRACSIIMNRFPYSSGHLMVFPRRHIADVTDLTPAEQREMMRRIAEAIRALRKRLHPAGFNVGMNLGRCAGAGLEKHIHMHVVPRWRGDTNFMPVVADVRVMPQLLTDLWDQIRPLFKRGASARRD
ncbi:MAG: HIT domain-containing protein [Verrucomicrobiota bacterium]|nr:HIT domain-containing protein [Verrucomicrobiota bacterium]